MACKWIRLNIWRIDEKTDERDEREVQEQLDELLMNEMNVLQTDGPS